MSIASKVPPEEAEKALLEELDKVGVGSSLETNTVVTRAIKYFASLTPAELQRRTPSGREWWPGYFRFALDRLRKAGEATKPQRGLWAITQKGRQRISGVKPPLPTTFADKLRDVANHLLDVALELEEIADSQEKAERQS